METVRRRKLCRFMIRLLPKKELRKLHEMDSKNEEWFCVNKCISGNITASSNFLTHIKEENINNCSNDEYKCHPYEGNINWEHVMADVLSDTHTLEWYINTMLNDLSNSMGTTPTAEHLQQRCKTANDVTTILQREVYFAERGLILGQMFYDLHPPLISMMHKKQKRKKVACGRYRCYFNRHIDKATKYLRLSKTKSEKRIHRNKLLVFEGLKRAAKCNPLNPQWLFYL